METVLRELTNLGSEGVSIALQGYTRWYLVSAIGWLIIGFIVVIAGFVVGKKKVEADKDYEICDGSTWNDWLRYMVAGVILFLGALMVLHNLSTVCAPQAYAIHHLIKDISH